MKIFQSDKVWNFISSRTKVENNWAATNVLRSVWPFWPGRISHRCLQERRRHKRWENGMKSKENGYNSHFRAEWLSLKEKFWAKVEKLLWSKKITLSESFILLERQPFSKRPWIMWAGQPETVAHYSFINNKRKNLSKGSLYIPQKQERAPFSGCSNSSAAPTHLIIHD